MTRCNGENIQLSLWHLTFNEDFAIGFTGLLGNRHALGEAFHITGDEVLTWDQIYQTIADALGVDLLPFHIGVRRALDYVLSHPEEYKEDPEFDAWCDRVISALDKAKYEI